MSPSDCAHAELRSVEFEDLIADHPTFYDLAETRNPGGPPRPTGTRTGTVEEYGDVPHADCRSTFSGYSIVVGSAAAVA